MLRVALAATTVSLVAASSEAQTTNPNPSTAGIRWTETVPGSARASTLGANGSLILSTDLSTLSTEWFGSTDDSGPSPVEIYQFRGSFTWVEAARRSREFVALIPDPWGASDTLNYYDGTGFGVSYQASSKGSSGFAISDAGRFWALGGWWQCTVSYPCADVWVKDGSSTVLWISSFPGGFEMLQLSGDGSRVSVSNDGLWTSGPVHEIYDVATGGVLTTIGRPATMGEFSTDGMTYAFVPRGGNLSVAILRETAGTYTYWPDLSLPHSPGTYHVYDIALSGDGDTLVAASAPIGSVFTGSVDVSAFDLSSGTPVLVWTRSQLAAGAPISHFRRVADVSDDGRWISVATPAVGPGESELALYDRVAGSTPVWTLDTVLPGTGTQISFDGQFAVFDATDTTYVVDKGNQGLRLAGTASVGRTITLTVGAAPGDLVALAFGPGTTTALPFPGFSGGFSLTSIVGPVLDLGFAPASGTVSLPFTITDGSLVGTTLWAQSLRFGSNGFDRAIPIYFTP